MHVTTFMTMDTDINVTYAAVGGAMTAWETLEAYLSLLYSIFVGAPMDGRKLVEYGERGRIFDTRMQILCDAAQAYSRKAPDQSYEAIIDAIIRDARTLSIRRHHIAHGVVGSMPIFLSEQNKVTTGFSIVPPSHGIFHLTKTTGQYMYGSKEINAYTSSFHELASKVKDFCAILHPIV
jgi:hypothetical protein